MGGAERSGDHSKSDTAKTPSGTKKDVSTIKSLSSEKSRRSFGKVESARRVSEHKTIKTEPRRRWVWQCHVTQVSTCILYSEFFGGIVCHVSFILWYQ